MAGRRLQYVERGYPAHIGAEPDRAAGGRTGIGADAGIDRREQRAAAGAVGEMRGQSEVGRETVGRRERGIDDLARRQRVALAGGSGL